MGGSSKTQDVQQIDPALQRVNAVQPPWMKGTGSMTIPQAPPGQMQMLANDLAAGGFGNPKANLAYLDTIYDPVNAVDYYKPTGGGKPKPKTTTDTGGSTDKSQAKQYGTGSWYQTPEGQWVEMTRHIPSGRNAR